MITKNYFLVLKLVKVKNKNKNVIMPNNAAKVLKISDRLSASP